MSHFNSPAGYDEIALSCVERGSRLSMELPSLAIGMHFVEMREGRDSDMYRALQDRWDQTLDEIRALDIAGIAGLVNFVRTGSYGGPLN